MMKTKLMMAALLACLVMNIPCFAQEVSTQQNKASELETEHVAQYLDKAQFLSKVWNYEKDSKSWKFLGERPCIIDFTATWCGPCRKFAPILDEIAKEYKGKIDVYKIDVDKESELAAMFNIRSIPTLLFCPTEGEVQTTVGGMDKEHLKQAIKKAFNL